MRWAHRSYVQLVRNRVVHADEVTKRSVECANGGQAAEMWLKDANGNLSAFSVRHANMARG